MRDLVNGTDLGGFRRYTWWSLMASTSFFLVAVIGAWIPEAPVRSRGVATAALVVTSVAIAVLSGRRLALVSGRLPVAWLLTGGVGAAVLGGVLLAADDDERWVIGPAMMVSVIATFLPVRRRWALIAVALAGAAVPGLISAGGWGPALLPPGVVAFSAWIVLGTLWAWDVAERLNEARRVAARLAVAEERLRFAADLHDIQGHHLQVIALKSELAARLAERDPGRAGAEMREVQGLATDALQDTRAVVQGYRRTTLDEEIANATRVLAAAEIEVRMNVEPTADGLPDSSRHLLGLVVREATTNVLRHSRARSAEVDYRLTDGLARLRVRNDGAHEPSSGGTGTGLRGLAERLEAAGGELTWGYEQERERERFVVAASLPVRAEAG
ncbi:sensor histidine kinase [Actinomadura sp. 9N407]|uniref:sensor histidine kinase n=1 Tax=Actinomadura sp. 9N407 TaxID=3375154 RepID=UPI00378C6742